MKKIPIVILGGLLIVSTFLFYIPKAFASPTIKTLDYQGTEPSIKIGSDGFARISYADTQNDNLKFVQCKSDTCDPADSNIAVRPVITTVDTGNVGRFSSLALGSDGFARITYFDGGNGDLKFVQCKSDTCDPADSNIAIRPVITTLDSVGYLGLYTSLALDPVTNYGRISYYDATNTHLKFVECINAACTSNNITSIIDPSGFGGAYSSIALNPIAGPSYGFARISFLNGAHGDTMFAQCTALDCSTYVITPIDASADVTGLGTSIALDPTSGFARISYPDNTDGSIKFVQCNNDACTGSTPVTIYTAGTSGYDSTSIALNPVVGPSYGFPQISYKDITTDGIKLAQCGDQACTGSLITTISISNVGEKTSLVLDPISGFPRISYFDDNTLNLNFAFCASSVCGAPAPVTPSTLRSDTLSRQVVSGLSNHTIAYTTNGGVSSGKTMTITFPGGFIIPGSLDYTDVDVSYGPSTGLENTVTLGTTAAGATWGASVSGQTLTITSGTGTIPAASRIVVKIGTNAVVGTTGDQQITNPSSVGSYITAIGGTFNENGEMAVPITQTDQTTATAIVGPSITFDIDTANTDTESSGPHTIALGTLSPSLLSTSRTDGVGTVNAIFFDLTTNAISGATVSIKGINGGLHSSSSNTTITLPANESSIGAGQERFGACVSSLTAASGTLTAATNYDADGSANCTSANGGVPKVGIIPTTPTGLFSTTAPVSTGRVSLLLKASVTPITPAADDYSETMTFIAVGTF